jgi:3-hydroxyacyl-CoA dehydrogenase
MTTTTLTESLGVLGSGAIAVRLARFADPRGSVTLWARSEASADRARSKIDANDIVTTSLEELADRTFVVEAIVEDHDAKVELLSSLNDLLPADAILASTTSSLSIDKLAGETGRPDRFVGLHVFNPVDKMELVELAFPKAASEDTKHRARALCGSLDKTVVEVPDIPGFVVNRLLFPYLFAAVGLLDQGGLTAQDIDTCMKLGAGHPMGPLALLDYVGLDVSIAIGESIGAIIPPPLQRLADAGKLGRKSGAGFYDYT